MEVKKKVFNVNNGEWEEIKFLRMNFINNYNFTMGHVDVSDQLQGSYRIDRWVQNRKWWWSMLFLGIGVLLTNAYVLYKKVHNPRVQQFQNTLHKRATCVFSTYSLVLILRALLHTN